MAHLVRDWMSSPVVVVDEDSSVAYAISTMRRRRIRSLVVNLQDDPSHFGIVTITDIRDKILAKERNPAETRVKDIMNVQVITAHDDWTLKECSLNMQKNHINHLPVVDQGGNLVGMISTTDLFIAAEEIGWESSN